MTPTPPLIPSHGDPLSNDKHFRFVYQNINGGFHSPVEKHQTLLSLINLGPDIIGISEPNLTWTYSQKQQLKQITQALWPNHRLLTTNCPLDPLLPSLTDRQQGGILQILHSVHHGRIAHYYIDPMGRWVTQTLRLPNSTTISIISAYRPVNTPLHTAGPNTVLQQQYHYLRRHGRTVPSPRALFLQDLQKHILHLQSDGHHILLALDANPSTPDVPLHEFLTHTHLHDLHHSFHPNPTHTHTKGNRLDYLYGTDFIKQHTTNIGILNSTLGATSDHAAIYIDLDHSIFGPTTQHPTQRTTRGFWCSDKQAVKNFRQHVSHAIDQHPTLNLISLRLEHTSTLLSPATIESLSNDMDNILTDIVLDSETKVRKRIQHTYPWSLQFLDAQTAVRTWQRYLKLHTKDGTRPAPTPSIITMTDAQYNHYLKTQLKQAWATLKHIKRIAFQCRCSFLQDQITKHMQLGSTDKAHIVRRILNHEKQRQLFHRLSYLIKGPQTGGLAKVVTTNPDGTTDEITDPDTLHQVLLQRNRKHFNQASTTPFAQPPYSTHLPPFQYGPSAEAILQGNLQYYHTTPPPPELLAFLQAMHATNTLPLSSHLSIKDYRYGMKIASEGKASSMSGRHYGIYKALLPLDSFTHKVVQLLNLGVAHGFILRRWRKVLQVMLCKQAGNFHLHRLRVIQLIEADLNLYFRLIWGKRLVKSAHHTDQIPPEQFGSVPGTLATSALLLKILSNDFIRLTRSQATIFNNDATACYDRVLPILSQICCVRLGLPTIAAKFKLQFLYLAEYYIKTLHGTSHDHYSNLLDAVYGVLQGSGAAPAIWLAVSIILILAYNTLFPTDGLPNPTQTEYIKKLLDAFVDDTDLWDIIFGSEIPHLDAIRRMQSRAQSWERLMFLSGGSLNLQKCYWYYVSWTWRDGIPSLATIADTPGDIFLLSDNNTQPTRITRVESTDTLRTLGLHSSPSGQNLTQFQHFRTQLHTIMRSIASAFLNPNESDIIIPVYLHPKLTYCLAGTTFTKSECLSLDRLFLPTLKSLMGYNRTIKTSIIHSSYKYGGAQIPTSWDIQGASHTHLLLGHLQARDLVGKYLLLCMDYLYLLLGFSAPVLSYPIPTPHQPRNPFIPHCWLTNTWTYLTSIEATLHSNTLHLLPQRYHDVPIMQVATQHFTGITLLRINAVRLYLQVFFLSDITTSAGTVIAPEYSTASTSLLQRTSTLRWPNQPDPGPTSWKDWTAMLRRCFTTYHFRLKRPLGHWLTPSQATQTWHTHIDPTTSLIYRKYQDTWQILQPGRTRSSYTVYSTTHILPMHTLPISLTPRGNSFRPTTYAHREEVIRFTNPPSPSFASYLHTLPPHEKWIVGHVPPLTSAEQNAILSAIQLGKFSLGSDGSLTDTSTTYSCRIQHLHDYHTFLTSHSKAPHTSTLRAEAYGYLSSLYLLRAATCYLLQHHTTLTPATINQFTDSKGVLQRLAQNHTRSLRYHLLKHSDVIREIRAVELSLPYTFVRHHVHSHQHDDIEDATTLPLPIFINTSCDRACTTAHSCHTCPPPTKCPPFPSTHAYLTFPQQHQTHKLETHQLHYTQNQALQNHLLTREGWSSTILQKIHWSAIEKAMQRSSNAQRRTAIKLMHRLWATGKEMNKRDNSHDSRCFRCKQLNEDFYHIFKCPSSDLLHFSTQHTLRQFLQTHKVASLMITVMIHGLHQWLTSSSERFPFHLHPPDPFLISLQTAHTEQTQIGWSNLLRGRLTTSWFIAHDIYYHDRHLHPRYSSVRLAPLLVQQLWDISRSYWKQRNDDIHGSTYAQSHRTQQDMLHQKVRTAYDTQEQLSPQDQEILFTTPLEQRLKMTLTSLLQWYALYQTCLNAPPEPTDTPPPPQASLHNFFRQFRSTYFPTPYTAQPTPPHIDQTHPQQPANNPP